jgi:hypothetical protein
MREFAAGRSSAAALEQAAGDDVGLDPGGGLEDREDAEPT